MNEYCDRKLLLTVAMGSLPTTRGENENFLPASTLSFCGSSQEEVKKSLSLQLEPVLILQVAVAVVAVGSTMKSKGGGGGSTMSLNDFHRMMSLIFTVVMLISLHPWLLLLVVLLLLDDESLRERLLGRESTEGDFLTEVKKEMLLMVFMSVWKGEFDGGDEDDLSSISMRVCMLVGFLGSDLKPLEEQEFRLSLRKSFSILGLRSIELNLLSCCTCVLIFKSE